MTQAIELFSYTNTISLQLEINKALLEYKVYFDILLK